MQFLSDWIWKDQRLEDIQFNNTDMSSAKNRVKGHTDVINEHIGSFNHPSRIKQ